MKFAIFGLTISSSWGNGHATLWRGLVNALVRRGHRVVFFERDVPYYRDQRDLWEIPGGELVLYTDWDSVRADAGRHADEADAAIVTSYCPDGVAACDLVLGSTARRKVFYDLDTPVTLSALTRGERPPYLPSYGLKPFDLVLSFTGGRALEELKRRLGARVVAPLYGSVDPEAHRPTAEVDAYRADLSYLGTYAADRQEGVERLFVAAAHRLPRRRFVIGGAQYPDSFPWAPNIHFVRHLPPAEHPAFFSSSLLTLNVTRDAMRRMGWCPSGRLFEAAACGVPILTDAWEGLESFFEPGREILVATDTDDVTTAMLMPREHLATIARRARERVLLEHTAERRAADLRAALDLVGTTGSD
ncbi:glycosyltransferase [Azospirillum sp. RWY-5-1]|uniref:Glycosyltransferase n=1 Tax=Azospirillum oleiclasticum TaxID=2735135 RepID=A0ABX2TL06_9PROT|nr:glycosyltransferase [Azospirillum oleiclasticum]NYZ17442.1 glycosyltransferase [Azospirillum oleiclasticum]NYZ24819.1 glycosyltransferase [Azospirillum oleiclasticum]